MPHYDIEHMTTGETFRTIYRDEALRLARDLNASAPSPVWQVTPVAPAFRHTDTSRDASVTPSRGPGAQKSS